ncbi:hypothetical protein P7C70_g8629, partial [Phenoliferia sp. Uapishka_3]
MSLSHSLRPRTHATYVDDSASETETDSEPVSPPSKAWGKVEPASLSLRRRGAVTAVQSRRRHNPHSPPTSPSTKPHVGTSGEKARKGSSLPKINSTPALNKASKSSERKLTVLPRLSNQGLDFLFSSSDNWMPFLNAWRHNNATELSQFAACVASVMEPPPEQQAAYFSDRKRSARDRAEYRRKVRYDRYAVERDSREDVRGVVKRWCEALEQAVDGSRAMGMPAGPDVCGGGGESRGEAEAEHDSDESEAEAEAENVAVEEYLVW